jgi:hypothetical protein
MRTHFPTQLPELGLDRIVRPPPLAVGRRATAARLSVSPSGFVSVGSLFNVFSLLPSGILIEVFHVN